MAMSLCGPASFAHPVFICCLDSVAHSHRIIQRPEWTNSLRLMRRSSLHMITSVSRGGRHYSRLSGYYCATGREAESICAYLGNFIRFFFVNVTHGMRGSSVLVHGGVAICYIFPVLWMTPCLYKMAKKRIAKVTQQGGSKIWQRDKNTQTDPSGKH